MKDISLLLRENIRALKPYSSARDEYTGAEGVFLDANENPYNNPYNRYPDPYQRKVKERIAEIKQVPVPNIFLGNGSDEPIDLLYRVFCEPGVDNVVSIDPTYGMYQVAADINNIKIKKVLLKDDFELDVPSLLAACDSNTKLLFLCSPNNPTSNCFAIADIEAVLTGFDGVVVLDEAYIDFVPEKSFLPRLSNYPNLVILQTFSKAWGMAGIRLGMAFASEAIIKVLSKIKYPYNINILSQQTALELLQQVDDKNKWVLEILAQRTVLRSLLETLPFVEKVFPSDANYLLIKTPNPKGIYNYLVGLKIIIRDRSSVSLCAGCLRITVGTAAENEELIKALKAFV